MKKIVLVLALAMISGGAFAQEKECCKKKGAEKSACCKDKKNCKKDCTKDNNTKKEDKPAK